jgi:hypothetical protein
LYTSCIITNTPGFYSGCKKLDNVTKANIVFPVSNNLLPLADSQIYAITANQLASYIQSKAYDTTIIYFWAPHCSGSSCIPIFLFNNYCKQHNYNGIVVAQYYDFEMLKVQNIKPSEIFAINQKYYKTDYCNKYLCLFQNDFLKLYQLPSLTKYPFAYLYMQNNMLSTFRFKNMPPLPTNTLK